MYSNIIYYTIICRIHCTALKIHKMCPSYPQMVAVLSRGLWCCPAGCLGCLGTGDQVPTKPSSHPPTLVAFSVAFPGFSRPCGKYIHQEQTNQIIHNTGYPLLLLKVKAVEASVCPMLMEVPKWPKSISMSIHIIPNSSQPRIQYMSQVECQKECQVKC